MKYRKKYNELIKELQDIAEREQKFNRVDSKMKRKSSGRKLRELKFRLNFGSSVAY